MKEFKITSTTGGSFKAVIPKDMMKALKWDNGVYEIKKHGQKLIITKKENSNG